MKDDVLYDVIGLGDRGRDILRGVSLGVSRPTIMRRIKWKA